MTKRVFKRETYGMFVTNIVHQTSTVVLNSGLVRSITYRDSKFFRSVTPRSAKLSVDCLQSKLKLPLLFDGISYG